MATDTEGRVLSDLPIPPGETLLEEIEFIGMTQEELARRIGLSLDTIGEIIRGELPVTTDIARKLENELGIPERLWINLETRYQTVKARLKERDKSLLVADEAR